MLGSMSLFKFKLYVQLAIRGIFVQFLKTIMKNQKRRKIMLKKTNKKGHEKGRLHAVWPGCSLMYTIVLPYTISQISQINSFWRQILFLA